MTRTSKIALCTAFAAALVLAAGTHAAGRSPGGGVTGCPKDIACLDVWDPVQCADGVIYSNQCYADRACAPKPCVSVEGGPVEVSADIGLPGAAQAGPPCIIRCSDFGGCQTCCVKKGGWVCSPPALGGSAAAGPTPDCGPNFDWDCTMPDGSHQFVDATRCEIAAFQRETGASCVLARF